MKELYCGIDIHKENFVGCIMDKDGKVIREHYFPSTKEGIENFICGIPSPQLRIAIEACGIWRGCYKILTELGYNVKLANPKKTHEIACNKKTDKVDAKILADLLRTRYLPEVYIPDEDILQLRDIARHRCNLVRLRTQVQCKIKGYLLREGKSFNGDIWNELGLKKLEALNNPNITNFIRIYRQLKLEEKEVVKRIKAIARNKEKTNLLMTIPGIAEFSSLLVLAEIGDIKRFETPKQLIAYAGLCPGIYQSAETQRSVRNYAVNKWLKWILTECSGRATMLDSKFKKYYYKIKAKKGFKTARRATARKMLTIIWHMLNKEQPYAA